MLMGLFNGELPLCRITWLELLHGYQAQPLPAGESPDVEGKPPAGLSSTEVTS